MTENSDTQTVDFTALKYNYTAEIYKKITSDPVRPMPPTNFGIQLSDDCIPPHFVLLVAQRYDRIQRSGFVRGIETKKYPDRGTDAKRQQDRTG